MKYAELTHILVMVPFNSYIERARLYSCSVYQLYIQAGIFVSAMSEYM